MPHIEEIGIEEFISRFKEYEEDDVLKRTFTCGFCYFFAIILKHRFPEGEIYYHLSNHYVFKLNERLYDITGDCTEEYNDQSLMKWADVESYDSGLYKNLIVNCVLKNDTIYP